jgi:hypothetical protein
VGIPGLGDENEARRISVDAENRSENAGFSSLFPKIRDGVAQSSGLMPLACGMDNLAGRFVDCQEQAVFIKDFNRNIFSRIRDFFFSRSTARSGRPASDVKKENLRQSRRFRRFSALDQLGRKHKTPAQDIFQFFSLVLGLQDISKKFVSGHKSTRSK